MGFATRLVLAIGDKKIKDIAEESGVPDSTLRSYLTHVEPKITNVVALARATEVRIEWLACGEGPMRYGEKGQSVTIAYLSNNCLTDGQKDWHAAKKGYVSHTQVSTDWIFNDFGVSNPDLLRWVYVDSDAMGPALRKGNLALIQLCHSDGCCSEGVYAVYMDGGLLFRRVQPGGRNKIIFSPDNSIYKPVTHESSGLIKGEIPAGVPLETIGVIGKVIYICHRI